MASAAAAATIGTRGVSIGGDVVGSVIVTGDGNVVNLVLGPEHGALLQRLPASQAPVMRLRPAPVRLLSPAFANTVDREREVRAVLDALGAGGPVNVFGEADVGKTHVLLRAANAREGVLDAGVVYLRAAGPLEDVLQLVLDAYYEGATKLWGAELARSLAAVSGVVVLDGVVLDRDEGQQLVLGLPNTRLAVGSRMRVLWDGRAIEVRGLEPRDAAVVIEQELGRELSGEEHRTAERLAAALRGHPLRLREAVSGGRSLAEIAAGLDPAAPEESLARDALAAAGPEGRRLVAALAVFGGASLDEDQLRAVADVRDFDDELAAALQRGDIRRDGTRYALGLTLARPSLALADAGERALEYFTRWATERRAAPAAMRTQAEAVLGLLRWARSTGRDRDVVALGRRVDHVYALDRRFGAWARVLELVLSCAQSTGDRAAEAWARHQLGTRALAIGDTPTGLTQLDAATRLRQSLGDREGAKASARNAALAGGRRGRLARLAAHPARIAALLIVALIVVGGVLATEVSQDRSPAATATLAVHVQGNGRVVSTPAGIDCPGRCQARLHPGTRLTLDARHGAGARFAGWRGACTGAGPCTLSLRGTQTVTAVFAAAPGTPSQPGGPGTPGTPGQPGGPGTPTATQFSLAVRSNGTGSGTVSSGDGTLTCPSACAHAYPAGRSVSLSAVPKPGSSFAGWSGAGCSGTGTCTVTMRSATTVTATFTTSAAGTYTLTVGPSRRGTITSQDGTINCPAACSHTYPAQTQVVLSVTPSKGYSFAGWSGGGCSGTGSCTVTMTAAQTVTATYAAAPVQYTLTVGGSRTGIITSSDGKIDCGASCTASYPSGQPVTLTASGLHGYVFASWGGACAGTSSSSCQLTMDTDIGVSASYTPPTSSGP